MKVGIDSVEVKRFKKMKQLETFLKKYFTEGEIQYIYSKNAHKYETIAGLFAGKEAFLKALQIGVRNGVSLQQIEIKHNENGAPYIVLSSNIENILKEQIKIGTTLSITHTKEVATAICIIE